VTLSPRWSGSQSKGRCPHQIVGVLSYFVDVGGSEDQEPGQQHYGHSGHPRRQHAARLVSGRQPPNAWMRSDRRICDQGWLQISLTAPAAAETSAGTAAERCAQRRR
jgi:hypothetical protein